MESESNFDYEDTETTGNELDGIVEEEDQFDVDYLDYEATVDVVYDEELPVNDNDLFERKVDETIDLEDSMKEVLIEESLIEEAVVEENEVNIDAGFLKDDEGSVVELVPSRITTSNTSITPVIFVFLVVGGLDSAGSPVTAIDVLSSVLANLTSSFALPALAVGCPQCTTSFSPALASLTSCSPGSSSLSPYGWVGSPGSCSSLRLGASSWSSPKVRSPARSGASIAKVGKLVVKVGGSRQGRALRAVEGRLAGRAGAWARLAELPVGVEEHCAVGLGKGEMMVAGGRYREDKVLKLRMKDSK